MNIIEYKSFTKIAKKLFNQVEKQNLLEAIISNPKAGDVIRNSGGIRKLRFVIKNKGKSGGARVIYYAQTSADNIHLLYCYSKSFKSDLTKSEIKLFKNFVNEIKQ